MFGQQGVNMPLVPFISDPQAWIEHFKDPANAGKPLKPTINPPTKTPPPVEIKLVSPVQQVVDQAKVQLKKKKKSKQVWDI